MYRYFTLEDKCTELESSGFPRNSADPGMMIQVSWGSFLQDVRNETQTIQEKQSYMQEIKIDRPWLYLHTHTASPNC